MTISGALSNALSGLTAAARMADVVASNTANAMTEGYARREVELAARALGAEGAGVRVVSVSRMTNEVMLQDQRLADAAKQNAALRANFLTRVEGLIGNPGDGGSLSGRLSSLETSLIEATSRPDSEARLRLVLSAAQGVAEQLNSVSDSLQQMRMDADKQLGAQVSRLNEALGQIDRLNAQIMAHRASGHDANALMDQRQALVDEISAIVPVRQAARDHDQIALFTPGGAILLEGSPARIGFAPVGVITPDMTQASGALSGLTINGQPVRSTEDGLLGGGTLGALFALRDELAPAAQSQIDAFARNLVSRFQDPTLDPTLNPGDPGLFTDGGGALDITGEVGLAGRIEINALVDPDQGGALWRLRDGIGAAAPGEVGNSALLNALGSALATPQIAASGSFGTAARDAQGLAAELLSDLSAERQSAEATHSFNAARHETLHQQVLSDGVDTDHEMQMLLQIERAYSANAKVVQTVDALIQQLLEM